MLAPSGRRYFALEAVPMGARAALDAKGRNLMGKKRRFLPKADCRFSPLGLLPLAIPSTPPLSVWRSSRALPAFLLHQTASSAVASVATLCFAPTRSTVWQVSRGDRPRTSYLFLSCSCLHAAKNRTQTRCRFLYWCGRKVFKVFRGPGASCKGPPRRSYTSQPRAQPPIFMPPVTGSTRHTTSKSGKTRY